MISAETSAIDARNTAADRSARSAAADRNARSSAADANARASAADLNARGAASEVNARGTASDVNARATSADVSGRGGSAGGASPAALQLASKGKKAATAKGTEPGVGHSGHKGPTSFVRLLTAKLAVKDLHAPLKDPAAVPAAVAKTAESGAKKLVLKLATARATEEKAVLAGTEETDGKKKPVRSPAISTHSGARESLALSPAPNGPVALRAEKTAQARESVPAAGSAHAGHAGTPTAAVQAAAPKIHVVDLRRKAEAGRASEEATAGLRNQQALSGDKDVSASLSQRPATAFDSAGNLSFKQAPPAVPTGQTPLERFREMAGSELVKATNLILRDGGGEIRLVLKPESLGSVRIKMHLVDNTIEGKIVVDNQAVKQVIDGNLDSLMRALRAEGFQGATLQVSVGGQNADNRGQTQDERPEALRRVSVQGFQRSIPGVEDLSMGDLLVNLFV
jgi:flagellar hook-length control protein FliK